MNKMKCKVIMISANKAENQKQIWASQKEMLISENKRNEKGVFSSFYISNEHSYKPQHLYFVSDEEILLSSDNKGVFIRTHPMSGVTDVIQNPELISKYKYHKIVATTDITLGLPLIPQSFVEEYVESNGGIKEIMVEMTSCELNYEIRWDIAVRKDKTVMVSKVRNTRTKDEIVALCRECYYKGRNDEYEERETNRKLFPEEMFKDWMKQNL